MKAHIITKTYDNNSTVVDRVFSSKKKAEKWLEKDLETYRLDGYTTQWMLGRGYLEQWEVFKNGNRKYIYRIESVEVE